MVRCSQVDDIPWMQRIIILYGESLPDVDKTDDFRWMQKIIILFGKLLPSVDKTGDFRWMQNIIILLGKSITRLAKSCDNFCKRPKVIFSNICTLQIKTTLRTASAYVLEVENGIFSARFV